MELSAKSLSSDNNVLSREIVELRNTSDVLRKKLREEVRYNSYEYVRHVLWLGIITEVISA